MKITGGEAKGVRLKALYGVRPTSGKVREAIFSSLENLAPDWSKVLDLYAGTGALGIEALSRGSGSSDFVEISGKMCDIIRENLVRAGFEKRGKILRMRVEKAISELPQSYGIIFLDPPYKEDIKPVLEKLFSSKVVNERTVVVVEHSRRKNLPDRFGEFVRVRALEHGDTVVSIYKKEVKIEQGALSG